MNDRDPHVRFVQIAASSGGVYALDEEGRVYSHNPSVDRWVPMTAQYLPFDRARAMGIQ